jgi:misacylated tRNA(Ala) deacylase
MVFKCQTDSFLKEFTTKVVKIEETEDKKLLVNFEVSSSSNYFCSDYNLIFLKDTVLFPEGGGQPTDHGKIFIKSQGEEKSLQVSNVIRKGADAIHFVELNSEVPLKVGDEVVQVVNWERRHDHMQQHSGQHLISALFEKEFKYNTKAWWLGADSSYIEIDNKNITDEEMKKVETMCNELIAESRTVKVQIYETADSAGEEVTRASKGLPVDLSGPVRVINIEGVDSNMCCGTHVTNLAQLQVIKLMNIEKTKNKTLVHFLVGKRVIKKLESSFQRELQFNLLLK